MKKIDSVYEVVAYETFRKVYRVSAGSAQEAKELVVDRWYDDTITADVEESQGELDIQEVEVYETYEDYLMEREEY